jgi:hypothetical protein
LDSVINKWKKLKQQYRGHVDKKKRSGTGRRKNWKFFEMMDQVCGHRDTTSPTCLFDSSMVSMDNEITGNEITFRI